VKAGAPWRGLPEAPHSRNPGACELPHVGGMPATVLFVCPCPPTLTRPWELKASAGQTHRGLFARVWLGGPKTRQRPALRLDGIKSRLPILVGHLYCVEKGTGNQEMSVHDSDQSA
jgi:hypothetical protein